MDTVAEFWSKACSLLAKALGQDTYSRWIEVIKPGVFEKDGTFVLNVDNDFQKMWLEDNYSGAICNALCSIGAPAGTNIRFQVQNETPVSAVPPPPPPAEKVVSSPRPRSSSIAMEALLNPEFTFENFVTGPSNSWAYNAAGEVARKPGRAYNPLFIYGPTGIGKTHLMQAIGHRILQGGGNVSVRYVTCEAMLNDYVDCVAHKENFVNFRKRYRSTDVLMVDDIQFLTGKEGLQEEFFNTYNELYTRHKQIIMTSDLPPKEIAGLPDRLVSRFGEGLVTQIESPNFETRLAILRYKQSVSTVKLADELLTFIANNITSNVRALEGALTRAVSFLSLSEQSSLSVDALRALLKDQLDNEMQKDLTCDEIQHAVAEFYNLRMTDMSSRDRQRSVAEPRQLAMFLCRKLTKKSLPEIGNVFGKSHATVFHSCVKIQNRLGMEKELNGAVTEITRKLGRDPVILLRDE